MLNPRSTAMKEFIVTNFDGQSSTTPRVFIVP